MSEMLSVTQYSLEQELLDVLYVVAEAVGYVFEAYP